VLNLRLDSALAGEIDRIAAWRGKTASEVARELLQYGIRVERDLQAQELRRKYDWGPVDRNADNVRIEVNAVLKWLSYRELADMEAADDEERDAISEYEARRGL
jgi:hypothetical protein